MNRHKEIPPRLRGETAIYQDDPFELGEVNEADFQIVNDFLPRPEELAAKEPKPETERVSLVLDKPALEFFRKEAQKLGASYQRMIRNLVNEYAARHKDNG